ncbi:redoxin domain-containing protein [Glaciecola sp. MH2013]|nr:redoxin domain-containing protein [Glaciecola sp. MH2013]
MYIRNFIRKSSWPRDIVLGLIIVFAVMAWQNRNLLDSDGSIQINSQSLISLKGEIYKLAPSNKKTLIYFFAPWCTVCKLSIGNLDAVDTQEFNVIRVALDYQSVEEIDSFADDAGVSGTILLGADKHKERFNISGYPTYYILDENLRVIRSDMGYSTYVGLKLRTAS